MTTASSNVVRLNTPKDPRTKEDFNWDCSAQLKPGDTIALVTKMFVERGDSAIVFLSAAAISPSGLSVSARVGGGRRGVCYRLTILYTTATGEELDASIEFDCV